MNKIQITKEIKMLDYIARLETALKFYSNSNTYKGRSLGYEWVLPIEDDKGQKAKNVLKTRNF